jgi:hypothetical protein
MWQGPSYIPPKKPTVPLKLTIAQRGLTRVNQNGGKGDLIKVKAVGKESPLKLP